MYDIPKALLDKGLLTEEEYQRIVDREENGLFSLHWELRTLLYIGVLLFATGLGILVYQNIDTIGHQAILTAIAVACTGCFYYCFRNGNTFSTEKIVHPSPFFEYVLLLGCLLFLTFEGYIQFQYNVFGTKYDVAAVFPALLFSYLAYRFDHLGVLSMAITGIAAWVGIAITPLHLFDSYDHASLRLVLTGEILGIALAAIGWFTKKKEIKSHFFFTYLNFACHLMFVATLAGLFMADAGNRWPWFLWLWVLSAASLFFAKEEKSFYFLLISIIYSYVGTTYIFFQSLPDYNESVVWIGLWYFVASCAGIIYFLLNHKKIVARFFGQETQVQ